MRKTVRTIIHPLVAPFAALAAAFAIISAPVPAFGQTDETPTDTEIAIAVVEQLQKSEAVDSTYIDESAEKRVVTLDGHVDSLLEKERAGKIAQAIKGVRSVVNLIEVKPSGRSDEAIANDIEDALERNPATAKLEVKARVNDGRAVLTGMAHSWGEHALAEKAAMGVKGVRDVGNQITVQFRTERSDADISADINQRIKYDVIVESGLVDVSVNDGVVTLEGTVGSAAEKKRAERLALVNGVRRVDSGNLMVNWEQAETIKKDAAWESDLIPLPDGEIKKAVRNAFAFDPRVASYNPSIHVNNGVVTLTGVAEDPQAKKAAGEDAENTVGVIRVKNLIKVRPDQPMEDYEVTESVRDAFNANPYLDDTEVSVLVNGGVAYLSGNVDTGFERDYAESLAWQTRGVTEVVNRITVGAEWVTKSDWEIKADIKSEIWWSPFVDDNDINVFVSEGIATLTGTAESWNERMAAEENAYEGGAKSVINEIKVEYPEES